MGQSQGSPGPVPCEQEECDFDLSDEEWPQRDEPMRGLTEERPWQNDDNEVTDLTLDLCLERLRDIAQGAQYTRSDLLTPTQQMELGELTDRLAEFKDQQLNRWPQAVSSITKEKQPIEIIWHLHQRNVVPLQSFLESAIENEDLSSHLTEQLIKMCSCTNQPHSSDILIGVCCQLVLLGFPEKKSEDTSFRKVCIKVLDGITLRVLDKHIGEKDWILHTGMWRQAGRELTLTTYKKFCVHTVSVIVSHKPNMKVSDALKRQRKWNSANIPVTLKKMYKELLVAFGAGEVVDIVQRVLDRQEVNWRTLLSFLATFLVCLPSAPSLLQDHVAKLLHESLDSGDVERSIMGFLLARQGCSEGAHVFPPYQQWFDTTFGNSNKSPASSKKSFSFLVKFLTDLVPYEPADVLKVHILRPPFVPVKCRGLWTDYSQLAKTRLADLKIPLEETKTTSIYKDTSNQADPGGQDVEKALASFSASGKLPTTVLEASIFRKPYFVGRFLPALLRPRRLPDEPDAEMMFIEELKKAGKIPSAMLAKYEEDCLSAFQHQQEGASEEADDIEEAWKQSAPLKQLISRLDQLTSNITCQTTNTTSNTSNTNTTTSNTSYNTATTTAEMMSVLREKLEAVLRLPADNDFDTDADADDSDSVAATQLVCVIDLCHPALPTEHVKVVDEVLNCACRGVNTVGMSDSISHNSWLAQLVRMLTSQHTALVPSLVIRLLTLIDGKPPLLSQQHMEGLAVFTVHLMASSALLPPVEVKTPDNHHDHHQQSQLPLLLPFFLQCLPMCTPQETNQALRFVASYLEAAFLRLGGVGEGEGSTQNLVLPPYLIVMACLLSWRALPDTRPGAQLQQPPALQSSPSASGDLSPWPGPKTEKFSSSGEGERCLLHASRVMRALFASHTFQELVRAKGPSLQDWLSFELGVHPDDGCLSVLQRQSYIQEMIVHFSKKEDSSSFELSDTGSSGGGDGGVFNTCLQMMEHLAKAFSRSHRSEVKCSLCRQGLPVHPHALQDTPVNPHAADQFLMMLPRLLSSVAPGHNTGEGEELEGEPVVTRHLLQLLEGPDGDSGSSVIPHAVLRVAMSCPPHVLFVGSHRQRPTAQSAQCLVQLINKVLVESDAECGVLSLDVICHLMQGYSAVVKDSTDMAAMEEFAHHPLIVLSVVVHWSSVVSLVPALSSCAGWDRVTGCLDTWDRFCIGGDPPEQLPDRDPFLLATSLLASLRHRSSSPGRRKEIFQYLHQQEPKTLQFVSLVLLVTISHPSLYASMASSTLQAQSAVSLHWLSELWDLFPALICSTLQRDSELSSLSRCLMSAAQEPFTAVACLWCVACLDRGKTASSEGVMALVVRLFAFLLQQDQKQLPVAVLSEPVLDMISAAPLAEVLKVRQKDIDRCGDRHRHLLNHRRNNRQ